MRGEKNDASAFPSSLIVILKTVVDDKPFDIFAIQMREMRKVSEHSSQISELGEEDIPPLLVRPVRKGDPEIEQAHAAQTRPEGIAQRRQDRAHTSRQPVRQPAQKSQDAPGSKKLNAMAKQRLLR